MSSWRVQTRVDVLFLPLEAISRLIACTAGRRHALLGFAWLTSLANNFGVNQIWIKSPGVCRPPATRTETPFFWDLPGRASRTLGAPARHKTLHTVPWSVGDMDGFATGEEPER